MNEKERFAQNLKEILLRKGIEPRPSVLEREFHLHHYGKEITPNAFRKWLLGQSLPSSKRLLTLAEWLEVDLTELVSEARAYKIQKAEKPKKSTKPIWELTESYEDRLLFEIFLKLPQTQRKIVREVIVAMHKAYGISEQ